MEFEWDDAKHAANVQERGFGFDVAARIFDDRVIEWIDDRVDYGEMRLCALGRVAGIVLFVVYTQRLHVRRIISARPANRKERALWQLHA